MKALLCKEYGPAESLVIEEIETPEVTGANVLVRVHSAGLNFPDTLIIEGKYQIKPPMPFAPGGELAGTVIAVGDEAKRFKVGDRVMGLTGFGAFVEEISVPEASLMAVPDHMPFSDAAGFSMVYGTSYHALKQRGRLQAGETLLVLGAGGGVGITAVELGKAMGAKVIAAASSSEKLAAAKEAGADHVINYTEVSLKDEVKKLTDGAGVDVVYDPVGGEFTEQSLRRLSWKGRLLIIGFASGDIPKLPANLPLLKGGDIIGVFWGAFTFHEPQENKNNFVELFDLYQQGKIKPRVSKIYSFSEYAEALDSLANRKAIGKLVLQISDEA